MVKKSIIAEYCLLLFLLSLLSCSTPGKWTRSKQRQLKTQVAGSDIFGDNFTGFALFDPETEEMLYAFQADKYFTPASNTKIFTFYTALQVLGDSLPVIHYIERGDSLIFRGAGNPLTLHPDFDQEDALLSFLRQQKGKRIFLSDSHFNDDAFGPGWSWADYIYSYQPERSSLPLYGNVVWFEKDKSDSDLRVKPSYFRDFVASASEAGTSVTRPRDGNHFSYNPENWKGKAVSRQVPFVWNAETAIALLIDTLRLPIEYWEGPWPGGEEQTLAMPLPDTLYKQLMKDSDNFIAEQLLLMSADKLGGELSCDAAIAYAKDSLLAEAPDALYWYDGSGLTRYNLFTPRTVVHVLHQLYETLPMETLKATFPAGGISGTIGKLYGGDDGTPFVFAKTGSLRNKHCLSGYVQADSGKMLIFSFMHNNFVESSAPVKSEMDRVLRWIKANN